ncbi:hypothetical protein H0H87_000712 [Tephrocybe sp. NHM501043]|nr:hypothetical protein H0H87_000712 [Tephrocybe sp. NHM501043]
MAPVTASGVDGSPSHDYTEGASAIDINNALENSRRSRRDSQYSTIYGEDGEGTMFSGPGHSVNPTSVSRMSIHVARRRSSENWSRTQRKSHDPERLSRHSRRSSRDSQVSRQSIEPAEGLLPEEEDALSGDITTRPRRTSLSPTHRTVFSGLAHLFGKGPATAETPRRNRSVSQFSYASRRSRRSRRSEAEDDYALETDDEEAEERWGYSSGEEESDSDSNQSLAIIHDNASIAPSMEYDSESPSPSGGTYGIPLMSSDPVFGGEARIDIELPFEPPPPGPPSRQTIYIPDEDTTIRFIGYEPVLWRLFVWRACCIMSLGILGLLGHWFPRLWLRWTAQEKAFIDSKNGLVVIEVSPFLIYFNSR